DITSLNIVFISGWISSSVAQFYTVEVQPDEEVTVKCSNFSRFHSRIFWFKMTSSPNISCISSMLTSENVFSCDGKKICLSSNTSVLFLKIKQVNSSDSGLYFCGEKLNDKLVIVTGTYLKVQELSDGLTDPLSIILSGLTVFLLLVIIQIQRYSLHNLRMYCFSLLAQMMKKIHNTVR
uniref:Immunoglobulin domain-containing protein n=1 Tax=Oreochromis aureus TaxID=47969 RepID=A0A668T7C6_OREAU